MNYTFLNNVDLKNCGLWGNLIKNGGTIHLGKINYCNMCTFFINFSNKSKISGITRIL